LIGAALQRAVLEDVAVSGRGDAGGDDAGLVAVLLVADGRVHGGDDTDERRMITNPQVLDDVPLP